MRVGVLPSSRLDQEALQRVIRRRAMRVDRDRPAAVRARRPPRRRPAAPRSRGADGRLESNGLSALACSSAPRSAPPRRRARARSATDPRRPARSNSMTAATRTNTFIRALVRRTGRNDAAPHAPTWRLEGSLRGRQHLRDARIAQLPDHAIEDEVMDVHDRRDDQHARREVEAAGVAGEPRTGNEQRHAARDQRRPIRPAVPAARLPVRARSRARRILAREVMRDPQILRGVHHGEDAGAVARLRRRGGRDPGEDDRDRRTRAPA